MWEERDYEYGISHGVFYPPNGQAVPWNGLISVEEKVDLLRDLTRYIDGVKIGNSKRPDSYSANVKAHTYPEEFYESVLAFKKAVNFGFSYRTNTATGYKIHIVYGVTAQTLDVDYTQDETAPFEWLFSTKPIDVPEAGPSAHLIIDTLTTHPDTLTSIENALYGDDNFDARLPETQDLFDMFEVNATLKVVDNGDGTFTVTGPDSAIEMLNSTTFEITWPTAVYLDETTYTIRSF